MTEYALTTPREAEDLIARMFDRGPRCSLLVREDKAFKDNEWLSLGALALNAGGESPDDLTAAVARGAFEWKLPDLDSAKSELETLLGLKDAGKVAPKVRRTLDAIAAISVRAGLQYPKFDSRALETMPFRRSTTVVADTSAALQGGLDFVARYLHPTARIKVPAIVQVEIVNFAVRFLSFRRAANTRHLDLLVEHLMSQGGQRVLLRLELNADTELERTFLLGDPLRGAFERDREPDLANLNLSISTPAYVDRLILEAARQHQAQSSPGHRVQLLTSDEGLARMALAEGILPLFFRSVVAGDLFGKRLTGATLDPFNGRLREISMASVLWELATAFGSARIETADKTHDLTVSAFGEGLSWSPSQSHADLLWCCSENVPPWRQQPARPPSRDPAPNVPRNPGSGMETRQKPGGNTGRTRSNMETTNRVAADRGPRPPSISPQKFSVGRLFALIDALDNSQVLPELEIIKFLGSRNREGTDEYRRFLMSGGFIAFDRTDWQLEPEGQSLAIALRAEDAEKVRGLLLRAPSFALFAERLSQLKTGEIWEPAEFKRASNTYRTLGEATGLCAQVFGEGLYATPHAPDAEAFAPIALRRFEDLDQGDGLVATGAWIEALIRKDGIHPEIARRRLDDASAMTLLHRTTEGSTTEVRFDSHVIQVLRIRAGVPVIEAVHLYRGDYLIPGKSSSSLRIVGVRS